MWLKLVILNGPFILWNDDNGISGTHFYYVFTLVCLYPCVSFMSRNNMWGYSLNDFSTPIFRPDFTRCSSICYSSRRRRRSLDGTKNVERPSDWKFVHRSICYTMYLYGEVTWPVCRLKFLATQLFLGEYQENIYHPYWWHSRWNVKLYVITRWLLSSWYLYTMHFRMMRILMELPIYSYRPYLY